MRTLLHATALVAVLACAFAPAYASSPVTKGGVVKTVNLDQMTFSVSGAMTLGYDYQGLPGKSGDLSVKYTRNTVFFLNGVVTPAAGAVKPGNLLKRAWVKHGGFVELFSADSPLVDWRNASYALGCVLMAEKDGKSDASGFFTLRLECRDGKIARIVAVPFGGCHPSLYGAEVKVDGAGLTCVDGKMNGTVRIASTPPMTLELHAATEGAAVRGTIAGTRGEEKVQGRVNGEIDYPQPAAEPATAYFFLAPGWDGGAATTPAVLVALSFSDAKTGDVTLTPYNGTATLDAKVEKMAATLYPDIAGSFTVRVESDTYKPGVYTIAFTGTGTGQMGLGGAVGSALISERRGYVVTRDGQADVKANTEFYVRNARKLMPAP